MNFLRRPVWAGLCALVGCAPGFTPTQTPAGTPNLEQYAPGMWRMGEPPSGAAWEELRLLVAPRGERVTVVKLNDEAEGSDDYAERVLGWTVVRVPLPPEDDKPWTVLVMPLPDDVSAAVDAVFLARDRDEVAVVHCTHGRDRTSLVAALVQMRLHGWSKERAWEDMISHGFRWELPDLDAYWALHVP